MSLLQMVRTNQKTLDGSNDDENEHVPDGWTGKQFGIPENGTICLLIREIQDGPVSNTSQAGKKRQDDYLDMTQ
jgi:hypothetical protein